MFAWAADCAAHAIHGIEIDGIAVRAGDRHDRAGNRTQARQSEDIDAATNGKIRGHGLIFPTPVPGCFEPRRAPSDAVFLSIT